MMRLFARRQHSGPSSGPRTGPARSAERSGQRTRWPGAAGGRAARFAPALWRRPTCPRAWRRFCSPTSMGRIPGISVAIVTDGQVALAKDTGSVT